MFRAAIAVSVIAFLHIPFAISQEIAMWKKLAKDANLKLENP